MLNTASGPRPSVTPVELLAIASKIFIRAGMVPPYKGDRQSFHLSGHEVDQFAYARRNLVDVLDTVFVPLELEALLDHAAAVYIELQSIENSPPSARPAMNKKLEEMIR